MGERIFLAGASGAVGRRLVPLLVAAGHRVTGTTRVSEKADELRGLGAEPAIVDVFDAAALAQEVAAARPAIDHSSVDRSAEGSRSAEDAGGARAQRANPR